MSNPLRRIAPWPLAAATLATVALLAACSAEPKPKAAQSSATPAPPVAAATVAVTVAAGSPSTGGPAALPSPTAPPGAMALATREYPNLEAVSLSCDAANLLVLRTKSVAFYLETLVAPNYQCEQARLSVIQGAGPGLDSDLNSVRGKTLAVSVQQLAQPRPSGTITVTFVWSGGSSTVLTVIGGWQGPGS